MKFTVDVEDFYLEEADLASELKSQIKDEVVRNIRDNVKAQVSDLMNNVIIKEIESELKARIKIQVEEFIKSGKVKGRYSSDQERTVDEWINDNIKMDYSSLTKHIEASVSKISKELKDRYDLLFASQLITKIKEQGFLKEEAAKLLLTEEKPS